MAERPRCVLPADVVVISAEVGSVVLHLLTPGLDHAERQGVTLPRGLVDVVAGLRYLESSSPSVPERWISNADAALLLGLTERQVRNKRGKLKHREAVRGPGFEFLEADVLDEVEARAEFGSARKSSEVGRNSLVG